MLVLQGDAAGCHWRVLLLERRALWSGQAGTIAGCRCRVLLESVAVKWRARAL